MLVPRDYQAASVEAYFEYPERGRVPIFCAPTGSGKTVIQCLIAEREMAAGRRGAIFTPRIEIFEQTEKMLGSHLGYENVSTLRAGAHWDRSRPIHVVSWPTLTARVRRSEAWFPDVDYVLVDEAHLSMAPKVREILYHYLPRAKVCGFTATPARKTGKGLGAFYTEIKHVTSVRQLIKEGYLAPLEYWGGQHADTTGLKVRNGDWEVKGLSARSIDLVGDVIDNWLRIASDKHTLAFSVDVAHAHALLDRWLDVGVSAAVVHGKMAAGKRHEIIEKFRDRTYQVLVNCMIASYGFDAPSIDCVVAARKTKSLVLWLQMLGRGMRPNEGKEACMVLDHGDNTRRLGMAADLFRWRLDAGKEASANWTRSADGEKTPEPITCENCTNIFTHSRTCPACGWEAPMRREDQPTTDEELVRLSEEKMHAIEKGWPNRRDFYAMLKWYARWKGFKSGWAAHKYKQKCGAWPERSWWFSMDAIQPSARVQAWIDKEAQNYARRRRYAEKRRQRSAG